MLALLLAIVLGTVNQLLFKAFGRWRVSLLPAILVNYAACVAVGSTAVWTSVPGVSTLAPSWIPFALVVGALLFVCLVLMGKTTEAAGVTVATLVNRLSVAIPTVAAFLLYGDSLTMVKAAGLVLTMAALTLSIGVRPAAVHARGRDRLFPALLFIGFGLFSTLLKFVQARHLDAGDAGASHAFLTASFFVAFASSAATLAWRASRRGRVGFTSSFGRRNVLAGLFLGCSNYGSVHYLMEALATPGWQSSVVFPTVSIAIVCLTALAAWAAFEERLRPRMLAGLATGVLAIVLVNL